MLECRVEGCVEGEGCSSEYLDDGSHGGGKVHRQYLLVQLSRMPAERLNERLPSMRDAFEDDTFELK